MKRNLEHESARTSRRCFSLQLVGHSFRYQTSHPTLTSNSLSRCGFPVATGPDGEWLKKFDEASSDSLPQQVSSNFIPPPKQLKPPAQPAKPPSLNPESW